MYETQAQLSLEIYIHSKIPKKALASLGGPLAHRGHWALISARSCLVRANKKKFGAPGGASSALFRPTWPFWRSNLLARASPGRPRPRFSSPKQQFFRSFSVRRAFDAPNVQHRKNTVKTNTKHTSELPRIDRKLIKNRSASASDCVWRRGWRCERLGSCPGGTWSVKKMPRRRFWTALGRSWLARGAPRSAPGLHLGVQKPPRVRQDASPKRFWASETAQDRFFFDFGAIWRGFSSIFE